VSATTYRELTGDEIIALGQELENYRRWEGVRDYAALLYGPRAHEVTIATMSEYNDSSYDERVSVLVTDRDGEPLPPDFALPWWSPFALAPERIQEALADQSGAVDSLYGLDSRAGEYDGGAAYAAVKALATEKLGIEFLEHWQPHDPVTYTFIVDTPPTISYPRVYVEQAAG
jgi:hypothetical protein